MSKKRPTWTRSKAGRNRVHWVAYDDQPGTPETQIIDQGYAISLVAADSAARAALANAGIYQARRLSSSFGRRPARVAPAAGEAAPAEPRPRIKRSPPARPPEYLYTRHQDETDDRLWTAAHRIIKQTPRRIYVTRASCGPDQLGTDDERWAETEPTVSLDRVRLQQEGSVFAGTYRQSEFYPSRAAAQGDAPDVAETAFATLGLRAPCTVDEIKAAYRLQVRTAHPDRGGDPDQFRVIETAYRRLLREAGTPEA